MLTGCQKNRKTGRQTDKTTFQLSYQNKICSECQQDVKKSVKQTGRYAVCQADIFPAKYVYSLEQ